MKNFDNVKKEMVEIRKNIHEIREELNEICEYSDKILRQLQEITLKNEKEQKPVNPYVDIFK